MNRELKKSIYHTHALFDLLYTMPFALVLIVLSGLFTLAISQFNIQLTLVTLTTVCGSYLSAMTFTKLRLEKLVHQLLVELRETNQITRLEFVKPIATIDDCYNSNLIFYEEKGWMAQGLLEEVLTTYYVKPEVLEKLFQPTTRNEIDTMVYVRVLLNEELTRLTATYRKKQA